MRRNRRAELAKKLFVIREKYADHKYLTNIIRRIRHEDDYRTINVRHQNSIVCVYCGMKATGVDHVPPLSRIEVYYETCRIKEIIPFPVKISCCAECNRLLGNTYHTDITERIGALRTRLASKYSNVLPTDRLNYGRLVRRLKFEVGHKKVARIIQNRGGK